MAPGLQTIRVEANGLHFEVLTCGEGADLALCLHGFPEVALSWREQMQVLANMGYRAWAPNQRGYGLTSRPHRVQDYAIERLLEDVAALIDASRARRVVLLGHDWGGIVAWCFAARKIRPLSALIIINAPHPVCFAQALKRPGQMLRSWYAGFFQLPFLPEWLLTRNHAKAVAVSMLRTSTAPDLFPRDLLAETQQNAVRPGAMAAMIHWYRAFLRGGGLRRQLQQGFPRIDAPTMLLWGEKDPFLARYTTDGTREFVRDLRLCFLPDVSHWVQQDACEACNTLIHDFLVGEAAIDTS